MPRGIFPRPKYRQRGERAELLMSILRENQIATTMEIANRTGLTRQQVVSTMVPLVHRGIVINAGRVRTRSARNSREFVWRLASAKRLHE